MENVLDDLELIEIDENIKDREFFFFPGKGVFILCSKDGTRNKIAKFSPVLGLNANRFANKYTPMPDYGSFNVVAKRNYVHLEQSKYWRHLFNLYIWIFLEENGNEVMVLTDPENR